MKNITQALILLISTIGYSQKIAENKIDEFTKRKIIRTEWENVSGMTNLYLSTRISRIDSTSYLDMKFLTQTVTSIRTDDDVLFLFTDGEISNLKSIKNAISGYGDGANGLVGSKALGLYINCKLSDKDIENFKNKTVNKVRINTSQGYLEEEMKPKKAEKLIKMFELIYK